MKIPISNKEIPPSLFEKASAAAGNEEILFAICGDLDSGSRYSESLLLATKSKVISLDGENAEVFSALFEEIEDAAVKRMYGNAVLSVKIGGKRKNIFRCTYACASHAEAAAVFICAASSGKDFSDELGALEDSFEKEKRICPNCGRTLSSPGAVCYGCAGRGKMVRKFWKYIRPQLPALVVALVISLVTTSITLLPPYITKMLVDDIIPSGYLRTRAVSFDEVLRQNIDRRRNQPHKRRYSYHSGVYHADFTGSNSAVFHVDRNHCDNDDHELEAHASCADSGSDNRILLAQILKVHRTFLQTYMAARSRGIVSSY